MDALPEHDDPLSRITSLAGSSQRTISILVVVAVTPAQTAPAELMVYTPSCPGASVVGPVTPHGGKDTGASHQLVAE
jgi:hypothetical protein